MSSVIGCDLGSQSLWAEQPAERWTDALAAPTPDGVTAGGFGGAVHRLGCNQKLDVTQCVTFGWVIALSLTALWQMRKS